MYCTEASNQKSKYTYRKIFFYKKALDTCISLGEQGAELSRHGRQIEAPRTLPVEATTMSSSSWNVIFGVRPSVRSADSRRRRIHSVPPHCTQRSPRRSIHARRPLFMPAEVTWCNDVIASVCPPARASACDNTHSAAWRNTANGIGNEEAKNREKS